MEEIWNIVKRDLFILKYYSSFADLRIKYPFILEQNDSILI
jgi:hypothetical protein